MMYFSILLVLLFFQLVANLCDAHKIYNAKRLANQMLLCQFCKKNNLRANTAFKKNLLSHKEIYLILNLGRPTKVESKI